VSFADRVRRQSARRGGIVPAALINAGHRPTSKPRRRKPRLSLYDQIFAAVRAHHLPAYDVVGRCADCDRPIFNQSLNVDADGAAHRRCPERRTA